MLAPIGLALRTSKLEFKLMPTRAWKDEGALPFPPLDLRLWLGALSSHHILLSIHDGFIHPWLLELRQCRGCRLRDFQPFNGLDIMVRERYMLQNSEAATKRITEAYHNMEEVTAQLSGVTNVVLI
jgi:hypothetical protein